MKTPVKTRVKTRVKICGITRVEDALHVCQAGGDAIGLVFYDKSPRNVSISQASQICAALPPFVTSVGLFMDASKEFVHSVLASVALDLLQFHGSETPEFCASFNRPYIKAVGMKGRTLTDFAEYADQYSDAKGFLVDSHSAGKAGGTGKIFDWNDVPQNYHKPIILAGGLNPNNIADAIKQVDVYGLDLSSGVESAPGIKDKQMINQLMDEVRRAEYDKQ
jgi:phosphoribosylanthranilate isomerase